MQLKTMIPFEYLDPTANRCFVKNLNFSSSFNRDECMKLIYDK